MVDRGSWMLDGSQVVWRHLFPIPSESIYNDYRRFPVLCVRGQISRNLVHHTRMPGLRD